VALAIAEGAHPKAIQTRMGHSSINVTLDRYGQLFPELDEAIALSFGECLAAVRDDRNRKVVHASSDAKRGRWAGAGVKARAASSVPEGRGAALSQWLSGVRQSSWPGHQRGTARRGDAQGARAGIPRLRQTRMDNRSRVSTATPLGLRSALYGSSSPSGHSGSEAPFVAVGSQSSGGTWTPRD
jgi:hypothetical protein